MKKVTLITIVGFVVVVLAVFFFGVVLSPPLLVPNGVIKPPIITSNTTGQKATRKPGTFTTADVAMHNTANDCYLVINNNVYDVSSYIDMHPGGRRIITSRCGKEVTGIFTRIHSNRAWDLLKNFKVGRTDNIPVTSSTNAKETLDMIAQGLSASNPGAEIVNVKPLKDSYIAKIIYQGKLYEVHIDKNGNITKEEVQSDEFNWSTWDTDNDDQ